jgi:hypothetical protein
VVGRTIRLREVPGERIRDDEDVDDDNEGNRGRTVLDLFNIPIMVSNPAKGINELCYIQAVVF